MIRLLTSPKRKLSDRLASQGDNVAKPLMDPLNSLLNAIRR